MQAASEAPEVEQDQPQKPTGKRQREAIEAAATSDPSALSEEQVVDATDWFMAEDADEVEHRIKLNVGGPVDEDGNTVNPDRPPVWTYWTVRPLDLDTIKAIRKRSVSYANRRARRGAAAQGGGEFDDTLFNLGVVVESTVDPDVQALAVSKGLADPRQAVKLKFKHKAGLVGQIVGEVLDLSGYNENDVQDAAQGDAAVSAAGG